MAINLGTTWSLTGTDATGFTQPIPVGANNACQCEVTVFNITAAQTLSVTVQESNDRENWATAPGPSSSQDLDAVKAELLDPVTSIGAAYVRLKFTLSGGACVFGATLRLSKQ
jgi:hypothetical protein